MSRLDLVEVVEVRVEMIVEGEVNMTDRPASHRAGHRRDTASAALRQAGVAAGFAMLVLAGCSGGSDPAGTVEPPPIEVGQRTVEPPAPASPAERPTAAGVPPPSGEPTSAREAWQYDLLQRDWDNQSTWGQEDLCFYFDSDIETLIGWWTDMDLVEEHVVLDFYGDVCD